MMNQTTYLTYKSILDGELMPALGCTEPIAIALAGAKVRQVLGEMPLSIKLYCSGNVIKNVKGVVVPNSDGMRGIESAATLGVVGGDADAELEVLMAITPAHCATAQNLLDAGFSTCELKEEIDNLFISIEAVGEHHTALVEIVNRHNLISRIERDGQVLHSLDGLNSPSADKTKSKMTVRGILDFAACVRMEDIQGTIGEQIRCNTAISQAGLTEEYGAQVGRILLDSFPDHVSLRAKARAAAGSDARMAGCAKPVIINSGSGNQGITVSLPIIAYAQELGKSDEVLYRALTVSNLISIHLKKNIGNLSAFCGAVTAAAGVAAAITYLYDGSYEEICNSITNTLANVGGIICDGAKASCAAKIASAVDAAVMASHMSRRGQVFLFGEGIVQEDIEDTIRAVGHVGRVGMKITDVEILKIMTQEIQI